MNPKREAKKTKLKQLEERIEHLERGFVRLTGGILELQKHIALIEQVLEKAADPMDDLIIDPSKERKKDK